jgi:hypothetical protein
VKHTFTLTVDVNDDWIEYTMRYSDIFSSSCAGYWLRGVALGPQGWLVWEDDDKCQSGQEPNREIAMKAWELDANPLPEHWFRLDRAAAIRAWEEGVKRWGVDWYEEADAQREDVVLQLALLGEVRYG